MYSLYYYFLYQRENMHFDVRFESVTLVSLPSEEGKDGVLEDGIGWKGDYFPPNRIFLFPNNLIEVLFSLLYTLIWRVNNCFPAKEML